MFTSKDKILLGIALAIVLVGVSALVTLQKPESPVERCSQKVHEEFANFTDEQIQTVKLISQLTGHKNLDSFVEDYCKSAVEKGEYK